MSDLLVNEGHLMESTLAPQKVAENLERAEFQEALPYIEHLIKWFDFQAKECDSVKTVHQVVKEYSHLNPTTDTALIALDLLSELLANKKGEIKAFLSTYAPRFAKQLEEDSTTDR